MSGSCRVIGRGSAGVICRRAEMLTNNFPVTVQKHNEHVAHLAIHVTGLYNPVYGYLWDEALWRL